MNLAQLKLDISNLLIRFPELEEDETLLRDTVEGSTDLMETLAMVLGKNEEDEDLINSLELRMEKWGQRKERLEHRVKARRSAMLAILQAMNLKKLELPTATLSQQIGQQRIVGIPDPNLLPDDLVRVKREANRPAVRAALLEGRILPGLTLSNAEPTLRVGVK